MEKRNWECEKCDYCIMIDSSEPFFEVKCRKCKSIMVYKEFLSTEDEKRYRAYLANEKMKKKIKLDCEKTKPKSLRQQRQNGTETHVPANQKRLE